MPFDGVTYDPTRDYERLATQFEQVRYLMSNGKWWTLSELAEYVDGSEAAISARIRDLRKKKFGAYNVPNDCISGGLWRYRIVAMLYGIWVSGGKRGHWYADPLSPGNALTLTDIKAAIALRDSLPPVELPVSYTVALYSSSDYLR